MLDCGRKEHVRVLPLLSCCSFAAHFVMTVRNGYMKYMTTEGLQDCGSSIRRFPGSGSAGVALEDPTVGAASRHISKWTGILKFSNMENCS